MNISFNLADLQDPRKIVKAIAGAFAGAAGGIGTTFVIIPADVAMPWYGYLIVGLANAALAGMAVYMAPANKTVVVAEKDKATEA